MIFVTGDTHGSIDIGKVDKFAKENPLLTKDDFLIICGDFGLLFNWTDTGANTKTRILYNDIVHIL